MVLFRVLSTVQTGLLVGLAYSLLARFLAERLSGEFLVYTHGGTAVRDKLLQI